MFSLPFILYAPYTIGIIVGFVMSARDHEAGANIDKDIILFLFILVTNVLAWWIIVPVLGYRWYNERPATKEVP